MLVANPQGIRYLPDASVFSLPEAMLLYDDKNEGRGCMLVRVPDEDEINIPGFPSISMKYRCFSFVAKSRYNGHWMEYTIKPALHHPCQIKQSLARNTSYTEQGVH